MLKLSAIGALAAAVLCSAVIGARAFDESQYPDWSGHWKRPAGVSNQFDTSRPRTDERAPLTPEYQAVFEANLKDQAAGGQGTDPTYTCIPDGMPRAMNVIYPMEIVILPKTTYIVMEYLSMLRRIFTDGRDFPDDLIPSFMGYSIGKWIDEDGDGRYDVLEVETRGMKGPRAYDFSGIPLHEDSETVVRERIYVDKADANLLHDDITTFDHALTRPWTVNKKYVRGYNLIRENICAEGNGHVRIGKENYMLSADGELMPAKKGQQPPSLRFFNRDFNRNFNPAPK
jgi:hypothetical protein